MMPRPRARGPGYVVEVVEPNVLASEVQAIWLEQRAAAVAIVTGPRNWVYMRRSPDFARHSRFWPGGEETFAGIPVVVSRTAGKPRVLATQQDLEDVLLGDNE